MYQLLFNLLLFVGVAKLFEQYNLKLIASAATAVLVPFIIRFCLLWILYGQMQASPFHNLTMSALIALSIQFVVAVLIFIQLRKTEDTIVAWAAWVIGGGFFVMIILPFIFPLVGIVPL